MSCVEVLGEALRSNGDLDLDDAILDYCGAVCEELVVSRGELEDWMESVSPMLDGAASPEAIEGAIKATFLHFNPEPAKSDIEEGEAPLVLMDPFQLMYMGVPLLEQTTFRIQKGCRYGLVGANGAGKTTLMTRIAAGDLRGFPAHLKVVYVEPLQELNNDLNVVECVLELLRCGLVREKKKLEADTAKIGSTNAQLRERLEEVEIMMANLDSADTRTEATKVLVGMGFSEERIEGTAGGLSGGWRMKVCLAHAAMMKCDLLLLDEPTNHLDVNAVAWLEDFVNGLGDTAVALVSHHREFLQNVINCVIHYDKKKLVYYHGKYYDFEDALKAKGVPLNEFRVMSWHARVNNTSSTEERLKFTLPKPGKLWGINRPTQPVIKLTNAEFHYPNVDKLTVKPVTVRVNMLARIGIVGGNGAGKSTLLKLMVGESEPTGGEVWKHHNLRCAYVAQHSSDHLEKYLTISPVDYMFKRFKAYVDSEIMNKDSVKMTRDEEHKLMKENQIDALLDRRSKGGRMEFLVKYRGLSDPKTFQWLKQGLLEEMGATKMIKVFNETRSADTAEQRKLTHTEIRTHLSNFGIDGDVAENKISAMSGGQKARLTLAAVMWTKPHILVLDEPTNFLDVMSVNALTEAVDRFAGGIVLSTHNSDFLAAFCNTLWHTEEGVTTVYQREKFQPALEAYRAGTLDNFNKQNPDAIIDESTVEDEGLEAPAADEPAEPEQ
eukprot:TRINITY_DN15623_c0_g1_i3.p1 TRINITY_DN15623_c0_g1~~TRINITY_DN15623_c0_g1_i3.p1  ORF type:complete len:720 (-),score=223.28 TRINITY_DN15623_c0_g1_i3:322-2481(-)